MDPCPFIRITISNLALKFLPQSSPTAPTSSLPTSASTSSSSSSSSSSFSSATSYYCKIKLKDFPTQIASIPIIPSDTTISYPDANNQSISACYNLSKSEVDKLRNNEKKSHKQQKQQPMLKIDVYSGKAAMMKGCGLGSGSGGKFMWRVKVPLELNQAESKSCSMQNGWVSIVGQLEKRKGKQQQLMGGVQLYLSVKSEPDPRFVFEFDGEPECSPQVFLVKGNIKQPVFTCNFSFRTSFAGDGSCLRSSTTPSDSTSRSIFSSLKGGVSSGNSSGGGGGDDRDHISQYHRKKERKGWHITIHDLSGSPVAAASMVTPFVPSHNSDRVGKSNPGAWLILRPGEGTWKPWGRLESWRESGLMTSTNETLGYRFDLNLDAAAAMGPTSIPLSNGSISARNGGKFSIDICSGNSPLSSPSSSFDLASWSGSGSAASCSTGGPELGWWPPQFVYRGFVMSSTVGGERKKGFKPEVEVGVHHVTCTEDAAVFVALAAAMDLSMDASMNFSRKLRKELR